MADRFKAFPAQATWSNSDGTLTVAALQTLNQIVKLFGGDQNILPAVFNYIPGSGTAFGIVYLGGDGSVTSTPAPTDGQILIGRTGFPPALNSPTGTLNRLTVSLGSGTITFDISAAYVGQSSITTLGTIATGTWNGTTIAVGYGGTGLTSYTAGDIVYASGSATLAKLADVATGNVLLSGGVGVAPSYGKVGLSTHVSGNLPIGNLNSGTFASATTFWRGDGTWTNPLPQPLSTTDTVTFGSITSTGAFGCNGKTAQTAFASGGAVATTAATNVSPYGYTTQAQADAIITLLNNIRTALVNAGIMS